MRPSLAHPELIVFSDDWGRHPSSSQHLASRWLSTWDVQWVNTVGMRRVHLSLGDLQRIASVMGQWLRPSREEQAPVSILRPRMYPGFRSRWQRRFNARQILGAIPPRRSTQRVAVTTLPITADLVGRLDVDRWVYYCVDDFSVWPGVDHAVMDTMERQLVARVDAVVCASQTLVQRMASMGADDVTCLTHGIDLEHWTNVNPSKSTDAQGGLFWGLIDERMDWTWCQALARQMPITLVGPRKVSVPTNITWQDAVAYDALPLLAQEASVLVMPYVEAPVTLAMQPLKLLEYLATNKPVVVRDLPATQPWADCCDVVDTPDAFVKACVERAQTGLPADQQAARKRRLPGETWSEKAKAFEAILQGNR